MNYLIDFLTSNTAKRFYWVTFAGFLSLVAVAISGIDWKYAPIVTGIIATITKDLNNKYGGITE
jgi:hypothetical protein